MTDLLLQLRQYVNDQWDGDYYMLEANLARHGAYGLAEIIKQAKPRTIQDVLNDLDAWFSDSSQSVTQSASNFGELLAEARRLAGPK